MKIRIEFPGGEKVELERQPMALNKFYALCYIFAGILFVTLILGCVALS
ncbi:hypothetical protein AALC17_01535 [Oscillospiraceae bacterium 38-13]